MATLHRILPLLVFAVLGWTKLAMGDCDYEECMDLVNFRADPDYMFCRSMENAYRCAVDNLIPNPDCASHLDSIGKVISRYSSFFKNNPCMSSVLIRSGSCRLQRCLDMVNITAEQDDAFCSTLVKAYQCAVETLIPNPDCVSEVGVVLKAVRRYNNLFKSDLCKTSVLRIDN